MKKYEALGENAYAEHLIWLSDSSKGKRLKLRSANLQYADLRSADLRSADLQFADWQGANLRHANLRGANLRGADLRCADLQDADLRSADLQGANLRNANLRNANLRDADLRYADLRGANLRYAKYDKKTNWPSWTVLLLADWGTCSNELTLALMRLDAQWHPEGARAFNLWQKTNRCPYNASCNTQRIANFKEDRVLWSPGRPPSPRRIMAMLLNEHLQYEASDEK